MGVLCSWYHSTSTNSQSFQQEPETNPGYVNLKSSYICTLFHGCFAKVRGTNMEGTYLRALPAHSILHTASELVLTRTAFDFICQTLSALKSSNNDVISTKGAAIEAITNQGKPDV